MIELRNVSKYYPTRQGRHYVLKNSNAIFPSGKSVGILGRNGTGKSTLLRLIGGIDFPNKGEIITNKSISPPMGLSGGLQGSLTARDNAKFVCRVYGHNEEEIDARLKQIQDFSELGKFFDEPVNKFSSGMRARFSFAISMAFDFDYYLIDELTAVGDPRFKEKSKKMLDEKKETSNIIYVSHNINEIQRICDIGVFFNDKQLFVYEDVEEAISRYSELGKLS